MRFGRFVLALLVVTLASACVSPPRPFTEAFYTPAHVRRDAAAAVAIAVYAFANERPGGDAAPVFRYESNVEDRRAIPATVPVGRGVARAFARGFEARGFQVTDATSRDYRREGSARERAAVTGRVQEFDAHVVRQSWLGGDRQHVGCRVTLEVYDTARGRRIFERSYARVVEGAMMPAEPLTVLSQALADVVEQAVTDAELLRAIRAAGG